MGSKLDMAKLFLVCHPTERKAVAVAALIGCSEYTVRRAMKQLNITPINKPNECRG